MITIRKKKMDEKKGQVQIKQQQQQKPHKIEETEIEQTTGSKGDT